jgi:hypothetical protein
VKDWGKKMLYGASHGKNGTFSSMIVVIPPQGLRSFQGDVSTQNHANCNEENAIPKGEKIGVTPQIWVANGLANLLIFNIEFSFD